MSSPSTPLRILHIDDEPMMLDFVKKALKETAVVDGAASLADGCAHIESTHYDMLLVDLNLGDSMGVATVEALKHYEVPIVVLSALDSPAILAAAAEAGASDYMTKISITPLRLRNRVHFAHARHLSQVAYERKEQRRKEGVRKRYLAGAAFEALKPFISCSEVAVGSSRGPFVGA